MTPENRKALELGIITGMMAEPSKLTPWIGVLRPEHFEDIRHRSLYAAMLALVERNEPIDATTLAVEIDRTPSVAVKEEQIILRGMAIDGLVEYTHVRHYVKCLLDEIRRRRIAELSAKVAAGELLDDELLAELREEIAPKPGPQDTLGSVADRLAQRSVAGLPLDEGMLLTPWDDLNESIIGLAPGTLTLVAARPGCGKTVFITNVAQHLSAKDHPVLFFSLEMSKDGIASRMLSSLSSVDHTRIRKGWLADEHKDAVLDAALQVGRMPLELNDRGGLSIQQMRSLAAAHKAHGGLALVVVDYAQLASDPKSERRIEEMSAVSRGLKEMAKELRVPVLSAVQLNRTGEGEKPRLSQIRECGQFEQDADTVLFLWSEAPKDEKASQPEAMEIEVWVAKNRQGPGTTTKLLFQKNLCRMVAPIRAEVVW